MSKSKKILDIAQPSLFDYLDKLKKQSTTPFAMSKEVPGRLNIGASIRDMISDALKGTTLSRHEVAAKMSILLGKEINKSTLDSYSAESKDKNRLPVEYLLAFAEATGNKDIIRLLCDKAGGYFIEGREALHLELGKIQEQKKELTKKERTIRDILGNDKEVSSGRN